MYLKFIFVTFICFVFKNTKCLFQTIANYWEIDFISTREDSSLKATTWTKGVLICSIFILHNISCYMFVDRKKDSMGNYIKEFVFYNIVYWWLKAGMGRDPMECWKVLRMVYLLMIFHRKVIIKSFQMVMRKNMKIWRRSLKWRWSLQNKHIKQ